MKETDRHSFKITVIYFRVAVNNRRLDTRTHTESQYREQIDISNTFICMRIKLSTHSVLCWFASSF